MNGKNLSNLRTLGLVIASSAFLACAGTDVDGAHNDGGPGGPEGPGHSDGGNTGGNDGGTGQPECVGLCQQQVLCTNGDVTRLSGTVTTPAGDLPLPNVLVYVPNAEVGPLPEGLSCDRCGVEPSGSPLVEARTDVKGRFELRNVPAGEDIPLVIQVGKWRRQVTIPKVTECTGNDASPSLTRLPSKQSEGDLPKIALTTGGADALECLLRKIGVDASEFTLPGGGGRVNFYAGRNGSDRFDASMGGGTFPLARQWWDKLENLEAYDIVVHSCEGSQDLGNKSEPARQALQDYAAKGGRVFLSHWHNAWLQHGPEAFRSVASWTSLSNPPNPSTGYVNTSFERGALLSEWLFDVGSGASREGELRIEAGRRTISEVNTSRALPWINIRPGGVETVQYFSFNAPVAVPEDQQCGRVVFSDIHVSSGDTSQNRPFPTGCTSTALSPQEKALVFMLFDLSACTVPDVPYVPIN